MHSVCSSLELGSPTPSPASECAPPPETKEGGTLACEWGSGEWWESQLQRLEKNLRTLPTLWVGGLVLGISVCFTGWAKQLTDFYTRRLCKGQGTQGVKSSRITFSIWKGQFPIFRITSAVHYRWRVLYIQRCFTISFIALCRFFFHNTSAVIKNSKCNSSEKHICFIYLRQRLQCKRI